MKTNLTIYRLRRTVFLLHSKKARMNMNQFRSIQSFTN
jgi:hypothetical protein